MCRYIDADKLLKSTVSKFKCVPLVGVYSYRNGEECFDGEDFDDLINNTPSADVVKVRHGKWKKLYDKAPRYVCSSCNHLFNNKEYKYCPECGAKMDGKRSKNDI